MPALISLTTPVSIHQAGIQHRIANPAARSILATLAFQANQFVPYGDIVSATWEQPTASSLSNLRTHITALRQLFTRHKLVEHLSIETQRGSMGMPGTYRLVVHRDSIDIKQLENVDIAWRSSKLSQPELIVAQAQVLFPNGCSRFGADLPTTRFFNLQRSAYQKLVQSIQCQSAAALLLIGETRRALAILDELSELGPSLTVWKLQAAALYTSGDAIGATELIYRIRHKRQEVGFSLPDEVEQLLKAILQEDSELVRSMIVP